MRYLMFWAAVLLVVLGPFPSTADAQRVPGRRPPRGVPLRGRPLRGNGEVLGLRLGLLEVKTATGDLWLMKIDARPDKIVVQGTAVPTWLRPRMFVRFSATLDAKGVAQAPIDELFVFTPSPAFRTGVFPDSDAQFQSDEQPPTRKKRRRRGSLPEGRYLVAGQLSSLRDGEMRVVASGRAVRAKLAENARIRVDLMGDYSLVRRGDKVEFVGSYFRKGRAEVRELTFTAKTPFGAEAVKPTRASGSPAKKRQPVTTGGKTRPVGGNARKQR